MRLETDRGEIPGEATAEQVAWTVAELVDVGRSFVVLSDGDETYVQAAGTVEEHFLVERRDGAAGEHYRGDRRASADELVALLVACLHREPGWREQISWHRLRVDRDLPSA